MINLVRYACRRLLLGVLYLGVIAVTVFFVVSLLPGDAATTRYGADVTVDTDAIRKKMGLDRPLLTRFFEWSSGAVRGDLGRSLHNDRPVADIIKDGLPVTVVVTTIVVLVLIPLVFAMGSYAASRPGGWFDRWLTVVALALYSLPGFVIMLLIIVVFSIQLQWLPPTSIGNPNFFTQPQLLIIPVIVLLIGPACAQARVLRAGMFEALRSPAIMHARRLGIAEWQIWLKHALPIAAPASLQQLARTVDHLVGGAIVVETIYALPGIGLVLAEAVRGRDMPVVMAGVLLSAALTILINLVADLLVQVLSPNAVLVR